MRTSFTFLSLTLNNMGNKKILRPLKVLIILTVTLSLHGYNPDQTLSSQLLGNVSCLSERSL